MKRITYFLSIGMFLLTACTKDRVSQTSPQASSASSLLAGAETFMPGLVNISVGSQDSGEYLIPNSQSVLHVPPNAFLDEWGNQIAGSVEIQFREYKDAADMAFSGLPMTYHENGAGFRFNSSGMFEITGTCGGRPVHIASGKKLTIDYELARKNDDIGFYFLDPSAQEWKKQQDIPKDMSVTEPFIRMSSGELFLVDENRWIAVDSSFEGQLTQREWINRQKFLANWKENKARIRENRRAVRNPDLVPVDPNARAAGTLLAEGMDAGHTYPDIIKGLQLPSFGVYNCDQIYLLPNLRTVQPDFVDANGRPVTTIRVLSLIDLSYNGAFSFDPSSFTCDAQGRNILMGFTDDKRIYVCDEKTFKRDVAVGDTACTLVVTDMTALLNDTDDLRKYLGL